MKIDRNIFIQFLREGLESEAERMDIELDTSRLEGQLKTLIDRLEDLDVSMDYLAAAFTGEDPLGIGISQNIAGRGAKPRYHREKSNETST